MDAVFTEPLRGPSGVVENVRQWNRSSELQCSRRILNEMKSIRVVCFESEQSLVASLIFSSRARANTAGSEACNKERALKVPAYSQPLFAKTAFVSAA